MKAGTHQFIIPTIALLFARAGWMQISQEALDDELTWSGVPRMGIRNTSKNQCQPCLGVVIHINADHPGKAAGGRPSWWEAIRDRVDTAEPKRPEIYK